MSTTADTLLDHLALEHLPARSAHSEIATPETHVRWDEQSIEVTGPSDATPSWTIEADTAEASVQLSRSRLHRSAGWWQRVFGRTPAPVHSLLVELRSGDGQVLRLSARVDDASWLEGLPEMHDEEAEPVELEPLLALTETALALGATLARAVPDAIDTTTPPLTFDVDGLRFHDDRAAVCVDGQWGYVDPRGRLVIDARYDDAERFDDGVARVRLDGQWRHIDPSGDLVERPSEVPAAGESDPTKSSMLRMLWPVWVGIALCVSSVIGLQLWLPEVTELSEGEIGTVTVLVANGLFIGLNAGVFWLRWRRRTRG